jgi:hypothetical protein
MGDNTRNGGSKAYFLETFLWGHTATGLWPSKNPGLTMGHISVRCCQITEEKQEDIYLSICMHEDERLSDVLAGKSVAAAMSNISSDAYASGYGISLDEKDTSPTEQNNKKRVPEFYRESIPISEEEFKKCKDFRDEVSEKIKTKKMKYNILPPRDASVEYTLNPDSDTSMNCATFADSCLQKVLGERYTPSKTRTPHFFYHNLKKRIDEPKEKNTPTFWNKLKGYLFK